MSDKLTLDQLRIRRRMGSLIIEDVTPADLIEVLSSDPRLLVEVLTGLGAEPHLLFCEEHRGTYLVYGPMEEE